MIGGTRICVYGDDCPSGKNGCVCCVCTCVRVVAVLMVVVAVCVGVHAVCECVGAWVCACERAGERACVGGLVSVVCVHVCPAPPPAPGVLQASKNGNEYGTLTEMSSISVLMPAMWTLCFLFCLPQAHARQARLWRLPCVTGKGGVQVLVGGRMLQRPWIGEVVSGAASGVADGNVVALDHPSLQAYDDLRVGELGCPVCQLPFARQLLAVLALVVMASASNAPPYKIPPSFHPGDAEGTPGERVLPPPSPWLCRGRRCVIMLPGPSRPSRSSGCKSCRRWGNGKGWRSRGWRSRCWQVVL